MTLFVYLNTCERGGATKFTHIGAHKGKDGGDFYEEPAPFNTRTNPDGTPFSWKSKHYSEVAVQPERGLAVLHFPSMSPEYGGRGDGNTFHLAAPGE